MNEKRKEFVNFGSRLKVPCQNCAQRKMTCHENCEKYKEFSAENEKLREMERKKRKEPYL